MPSSIVILAATPDELKAGTGRRLLLITQAAGYLGLSERVLREMVKRGEITPYEERLHTAMLFQQEDVEKLLESRKKANY